MLVDMPAAQQSTIRGIALPLCVFIASAFTTCATILLILCDSEGYMKIIFIDVIEAQFLCIISSCHCEISTPDIGNILRRCYKNGYSLSEKYFQFRVLPKGTSGWIS
jgi:hypothetical protein